MCLFPLLSKELAPGRLPQVRFSSTRLANGMRVFVVEDHYAPVLSLAIGFEAGSRDETPGRSGLAHLLEHMMYKGSARVGPGEHYFLIYQNGGVLNGTTGADRTLFYETIPRNQLELALFLESDRMRSLAMTPDALENQRKAVMEEYRSSIDNQPYGPSRQKLVELSYQDFGYRHSAFGNLDDLKTISLDDLHRFYHQFYSPNRAVLVIVGDGNRADILTAVKKFFGGIPVGPSVRRPSLREPPRRSEARIQLQDKLARTPRVDIAFQTPSGNTRDQYALDVLNRILGSGDNSRLRQALVAGKDLAVSISSSLTERSGPGLLWINATLRANRSPEEAEEAIAAEITRIQTGTIEGEQLLRVRNELIGLAVDAQESSLSRAADLADSALIFGDPGRINTRLSKLLAVEAVDVRRVAVRYLQAGNRTVVITLPAAPVNGLGERPVGAIPKEPLR
jgi:zinc protease